MTWSERGLVISSAEGLFWLDEQLLRFRRTIEASHDRARGWVNLERFVHRPSEGYHVRTCPLSSTLQPGNIRSTIGRGGTDGIGITRSVSLMALADPEAITAASMSRDNRTGQNVCL